MINDYKNVPTKVVCCRDGVDIQDNMQTPIPLKEHQCSYVKNNTFYFKTSKIHQYCAGSHHVWKSDVKYITQSLERRLYENY